MSDYLSINTAQFLQLDTNIRTSATSIFNAQEAYENAFEDVIQETTVDETSKTEERKINFSNLEVAIYLTS